MSYTFLKQASINGVCSYFVAYKITTTNDLYVHINYILKLINKDINIFNYMDDVQYRIDIFKAAVTAYNHINTYNINIPANSDWSLLNRSRANKENQLLSSANLNRSSANVHTNSYNAQMADLYNVTQSYDQLNNATAANQKMSQKIVHVLENKTTLVCDTIILGAGDTGTTLWLEKYKTQHKKAYDFLAKKELPPVLIIGENFGSWRHDYTLAQTHSSLERSHADKNPSDFLSSSYYQTNPQGNARHIAQANQICLASTQAPITNITLLKIEKKENHSNWEMKNCPYRAVVQFSDGQKKAIYTNGFEVCTGLGPANVHFDENILSSEAAKKLTQFDPQLGFTPIVNGNQFVLSDSEEGKNNKTIVLYGGGGTATACYRKSFFGHDIKAYNKPFTEEQQKNQVYWVYRKFIGTGKLATRALRAAQQRNEVFQGKLVSIARMPNSKLQISFDITSNNSKKLQIECDQLIYSVGQKDIRIKQVCKEVSTNLQPQYDPNGMLLYVSTIDKKIKYLGAAAVTFSKVEFNGLTLEWLNAQNIGGDVGPGSMPPTRAQIKRYLALDHGIKPLSVNLNMDTTDLIADFLLNAEVNKTVITSFIKELLLARKEDTYGCCHTTVVKLWKKYQLDQFCSLFGHSHLVSQKGRPSPQNNLITLMKNNRVRQRQSTQDDTNIKSPDLYFHSINPSSGLFRH